MSSVPEVVDALVETVSSVMSTVSDGVPQVWPDQDTIIVGGARDGTGISIETSPAGFGHPDRENVNVTCVIVCVGGDDSVKPVRQRAFAFYTTIAAKIRQDKTLGGTTAQARLSNAVAAQYLNESGAAVELTFVVSCIAFV